MRSIFISCNKKYLVEISPYECLRVADDFSLQSSFKIRKYLEDILIPVLPQLYSILKSHLTILWVLVVLFPKWLLILTNSRYKPIIYFTYTLITSTWFFLFCWLVATEIYNSWVTKFFIKVLRLHYIYTYIYNEVEGTFSTFETEHNIAWKVGLNDLGG